MPFSKTHHITLSPGNQFLSPLINKGGVTYLPHPYQPERQQDNINDNRKREFYSKSPTYPLMKRQATERLSTDGYNQPNGPPLWRQKRQEEAMFKTTQQAIPSEGKCTIYNNSSEADFYINWQNDNLKNTLICHRDGNGKNMTTFTCHLSTYDISPKNCVHYELTYYDFRWCMILLIVLIIAGIILHCHKTRREACQTR